jgi:hypothetical protein
LEATLKSQTCGRLSKGQKGIVRRFLAKVNGLRPWFMRRRPAASIPLAAGDSIVFIIVFIIVVIMEMLGVPQPPAPIANAARQSPKETK